MDTPPDYQLLHSEVANKDYIEERKAFDDTKAGVKGLVDAGVIDIPRIFVTPPEEIDNVPKSDQIQVPVIDFKGIETAARRKEIVNEVAGAAGKLGFFQIVNHSIPLKVMEEMIEGVSRFHELDVEEKKVFYTRDFRKTVWYNSNYDLFRSKYVNWRDTVTINVSDGLNPSELPAVCRASTMEYIKRMTELENTLFELLSEALGLESNYLPRMECANSFRVVCHYYPACPEPHRTLGCTKHSDTGFLTILMQNQISGLQILIEDHWIDVHPIPGALAVNIGDLLQLISNDKFKSIDHRATASTVGPRISVACFFSGPIFAPEKVYSPVKELTSQENPAKYREVSLGEYVANFLSRGLDDKLRLEYYRI